MRWGPPAVIVVAIAAAVILGAGALPRTSGESRGQPAAVSGVPAGPGKTQAPKRAREVALPIPEVERLVTLGAAEGCAVGAKRVACTTDGGASWTAYDPLPEHVLAVARTGGELLAAVATGAVYRLAPDRPPELRSSPPVELAVVDAAGSDGELWLLAHRYAEPEGELQLPRVAATQLLSVAADGTLVPHGALPGYGGERLLVRGASARDITIWALFDPRAFRSRDRGRTFQPVPAGERIAAEVGGLLVMVERRTDRLPGPGRQARAVSTVLVSRDRGGSWDSVLDAPGELLVDFIQPEEGVVVSRTDQVVWRTVDGGRSFEPLARDVRLEDAIDVARLGGRWVVVTEGGVALLL